MVEIGGREMDDTTNQSKLSDDDARRWMWACPPEPWRRWIVVFALIALALAVRMTGLDALPPGNWYDEAINGLDALDVLEGRDRPIFFTTEGHPREPAFIYATAATFAVAGVSTWSLRLTAALIGALTVGVFWLMLRRLRGAEVATIAALGLVFFRWHVHFSRTSFRTIMAPLVVCLLVWLLARAIETRRRRDWAMAGATLGFGFYTYLSFRFAPIVLALWFGAMAWSRLRAGSVDWRRHLAGASIALVVALVVFAPLGVDYARHPDHFSGRTGEVSLFDKGLGPGLGAVGQNAIGNGLQFFIPGKGDHVPKHNIPLKPVFDPLSALLFALGLVVCAKRFRSVEEGSSPAWGALALAWLVLMLMGSVFSFGAPNLLRTLAAAPAAIWIWAEGATWTARWVGARWGGRVVRWSLLVVALVIFSVIQTRDYFFVYPKADGVWENFTTGLTELGRQLNENDYASNDIACVPSMMLESPVVRFEAHDVYSSLRPLVLPDAIARDEEFPDADRLILATAYNGLLDELVLQFPRGKIERSFWHPQIGTWAWLYRIPADDLLDIEAARRATGERRNIPN